MKGSVCTIFHPYLFLWRGEKNGEPTNANIITAYVFETGGEEILKCDNS